MPKIPRLEGGQSIHGAIGRGRIPLAVAGQVGEAVAGLGEKLSGLSDVVARYEEKKATIKEHRALNEFARQDALIQDEISKLQGVDAEKAIEIYNEKAAKANADVSKSMLEGLPQPFMDDYNDRVKTRITSGQIAMSRHSASEMNKEAVAVKKGKVARAIADVQKDPYLLEGKIAALNKDIDELSPLDSTAEQLAVKKILTETAIQSMINYRDFKNAEKLLEENKDILGKSYETLKKSMITAETSAVDEFLQTTYGEDYDKQVELLTSPQFRKEHNLDITQAEWLIVKVEARKTRKKQTEQKLEDDATEAAFGDTGDLLMGVKTDGVPDIPGAMERIARDKEMDPKVRFSIMNDLKTKKTEGLIRTQDLDFYFRMEDKARLGDLTDEDKKSIEDGVSSLVSIPDAKSLLLTNRTAIKNAETKLIDKTIKDGRGIVLQGSALLGTLTTESKWNAYFFERDLMLELSKEPDPKKRMEMLDPENHNYIVGRVISPYLSAGSLRGQSAKLREELTKSPRQILEEGFERFNKAREPQEPGTF